VARVGKPERAKLPPPAIGVHCGLTMKHVGIRQARQQLPDLIDRVEAGEEIMITRQGKAVARLIPAPPSARKLPSLEKFRRDLGRPGTPSARLLREERDTR
jgi:prevent-host-death family protein